MKKHLIKKLIVLFVFSVVFLSCDTNQVYENNIELHNYTWNKDSIMVFKVDIEDTISAHNIYVNVRNTSQYEMQNFFLFIKTTAPTGIQLKDTFECYLADKRGRWTGKGWGDIYENQFIYKNNIRFPVSGSYTFELIQGMRIENLEYISDIGLRIEKVDFR